MTDTPLTSEQMKPIKVKMLTICELGHVRSMTGSFIAALGSTIFGSDADHCQGCEEVGNWDASRGSMTIIGNAPDPTEKAITWELPICGIAGCMLFDRSEDINDRGGWHGYHAKWEPDATTALVWKAE